MKVSTSVLSTPIPVEDCIIRLNETSSDYLHLDVMDGKFVSANTVRMMDEVVSYNKLPLDIHLMVEDVNYYIEKYQVFHPQYLTFHVEAVKEIEKTIQKVKEKGIKVGLALNPDTDVHTLDLYLDQIDLVLIMSVIPGAGGQTFKKEVLSHINYFLEKRKSKGYHYQIELDGGINKDTISFVSNVDMVVSGSYIVSGNYEERIQNLKKCK